MPRLLYVATLLAIASSLSTRTLAQASTSVPVNRSQAGASRVEDVVVHGGGHAIEVVIQTSGAPVAPNTQTIKGPDRIVVDFPGALPAPALRTLALNVNSGPLKGIRAGLFINDPPTTRVVLDLSEPQAYHISANGNAIVIQFGQASSASASSALTNPVLTNPGPMGSSAAKPGVLNVQPYSPTVSIVRTPRLQNALMDGVSNLPLAPVSSAVIDTQPLPPPPPVKVTYVNGMLSISADHATLAQVLFEVQQKTQAEIAIPAGAEEEEVISNLGPAPARDVLASLLNGSPYNFIFVGNESTLERVILTRRDPNIF